MFRTVANSKYKKMKLVELSHKGESWLGKRAIHDGASPKSGLPLGSREHEPLNPAAPEAAASEQLIAIHEAWCFPYMAFSFTPRLTLKA